MVLTLVKIMKNSKFVQCIFSLTISLNIFVLPQPAFRNSISFFIRNKKKEAEKIKIFVKISFFYTKLVKLFTILKKS